MGAVSRAEEGRACGPDNFVFWRRHGRRRPPHRLSHDGEIRGSRAENYDANSSNESSGVPGAGFAPRNFPRSAGRSGTFASPVSEIGLFTDQ